LKNVAELKAELDSFQGIWPEGFYQGDPADPVFGLWGITSFIGVSHAIYLACIKPYVNKNTTVLEIGCGRGAWTKLLLGAGEIYCLDALPPEHNRFFEYVGRHEHVHYVTVSDFSLHEVPMDAIDFVFSYDVLCHVSFAGISEYARNLFPRMRPGAHGFWMVADYQKYNRFVADQDRCNVLRSLLPRQKHPLLGKLLNLLFCWLNRWNARRYRLFFMAEDEDDQPRPGRWYHAGRQRTCEMLEMNGFTIVQEDMGFDYRSPLIHFKK
jgi:SAM-dependent methyltransferase